MWIDAHLAVMLDPDHLPPKDDPNFDDAVREWMGKLGDAVIDGRLPRVVAEEALRAKLGRIPKVTP